MDTSQFQSKHHSPHESPTEPEKEAPPKIDMLEIYIEKSRALGLGQRLLWHLSKINERLHLPYIDDANAFYLQPLSVKAKGQAAITPSGRLYPEMMYTEDSNTVFYYNDYKCVLLLDFSHSTTSVFPGQGKSYTDKMRDSLEIIIKNLLFKIKNQFKKSVADLPPREPQKTKPRNPGWRDSDDDSQMESDIQSTLRLRHPFFDIEEQSESGANNQVSKKGQLSEDDQSSIFATQRERKQKAPAPEAKNAYTPKVYLSIVVSGLPPGNNIKMILHNQKVEYRDLQQLLKSIDTKLQIIEKQLCQNIQQKKIDDTVQGALQVHLDNAQYILDLMSQDAKPLLVFFTDSSNSLLQINEYHTKVAALKTQQKWKADEQFGAIDKSIHKLHLSDTRVLSIDLQSEKKCAQTRGYVNHDNELEWMTSITQGVHLTYYQLMEIAARLDQSPKPQQQARQNLFAQEDSVKFVVNEAGSLVIQRAPTLLSSEMVVQTKQHNILLFGEKKSKQSSQQVQEINVLQKIMFARACKHQVFIQSPEIASLFSEPYQSHQLIQADQKMSVDLNLQKLLFEGKVIPLLQSEPLDEYSVQSVGLASLCEFRSKMGFKFQHVTMRPSKQSKQLQNMTKDSKPIKSDLHQVVYKYCYDSHITIECKLTLVPFRQDVNVSYSVLAPANTLKILHHKNQQIKMRERLQAFVKSIQVRDQQFQLLDEVVRVLHYAQILFSQPRPPKYRSFNHQMQMPSFQRDQSNVFSKKSSQEIEEKSVASGMQPEPKKKKQKKWRKNFNVIQTEEEARAYLVENKHVFYQLSQMLSYTSRLYQWKCYFRYNTITIVTQSANVILSRCTGKSATQPDFWQRSFAEEQAVEEQIRACLTEDISNFTSLTLDELNFIQVFEEGSELNQYKILDFDAKKTKFGRESPQTFGFCLIRLDWKATNIVECHFGFYQVCAKQRIQFLKQFKKNINLKCQRGPQTAGHNINTESGDSFGQSFFKCYDKNIASILAQTPKRYRYSLDYLLKQSQDSQQQYEGKRSQSDDAPGASEEPTAIDRLVFTSVKADLKQQRQAYLSSGIQTQDSQLFHKNEWSWQINNRHSNRELYLRILDQRLKDGFIVVNRLQGINDHYHLIKVLRASKDCLAVQSRNDKHHRAMSIHSEEQILADYSTQQEKIDIVVQFLISIQEEGAHGSTIREELLMEQEICYFNLDKSAPQSMRNSVHLSSSGSQEGGCHSVNWSCKNFFDQISDYMQQIDKQLYLQINTFHHYVKSSIHAQIDKHKLKQGPFPQAIKQSVCYFKNIAATNKRQIRERETQIHFNIQTLHNDWKQYLEMRYPEMLTTENEQQQQVVLDEKQLLQTGKVFFRQWLEVPQLEKYDVKQQRDLCEKYVDKVYQCLQDFNDVSVSLGVVNKTDSDVFFKLISKQILMICQVPCRPEMKRRLELSQKIPVIYFKYDVSMVHASSDHLIKRYLEKLQSPFQLLPPRKSDRFPRAAISKNGIKHVQSSGMLSLQQMNELSTFVSQNKIVRKQSRDFTQRKRTTSQVILPEEDNKSSFLLSQSYLAEKTSDNNSFEEDQLVNQIDQTEEIYIYYLCNRSRDVFKNMLQFETKVKKIMQNFVSFLQGSFEKIFAEVALLGLRNIFDELKPNQIQQKDFKQALNSMGEINFKIDLSFAYLLLSQIDKDKHSASLELLNKASDEMFTRIIQRNFTQCPQSPHIFIYKENDLDKDLMSTVTTAKSEGYDLEFNLQGTPDSYSENAESMESRGQSPQQRVPRMRDHQDTYFLCHNLIMKVEVVVINRQEEISQRQTVSSLTEVFKLASSEPGLQQALNDKVTNEIGSKALEEGMDFDEMFQQFSEKRDSYASVEIWVTFFTLPEYLGLLESENVDSLHDISQILVNNDLMEDLILVCKSNQQVMGQQPVDQSIKPDYAYPLFNKLKRRQIIKSIPEFFIGENHTTTLQVFFFDEIQRKSIYGVLRRLYALIGVTFTELVAMQKPVTATSILHVQKYFGYMLYNQRQHHSVPMFEGRIMQMESLWSTLKQELENCSIFQLRTFKHPKNPKQDLYYLVHATSGQSNFELSDEWNRAYAAQQDNIVIPFWCFFIVIEDAERIQLKFTLSAPRYKLKTDVKDIIKRLTEMSEQVALKVKKLVFLKQEVSAKRRFPRELKLADKMHNQHAYLLNPKQEEASAGLSTIQQVQEIDTPKVVAKPKASTSKFMQKMKKFQGDQSQTQPNSGSFARQFSSFSNTLPAVKPEVTERLDQILLETFQDLSIKINTTHCCNVETALSAVSESAALQSIMVYGVQNCYVVEEKNHCNIMRLSKLSDQSILMEFAGVYPPSQLQVDRLSQVINNIIVDASMKKIATEAILRGGCLTSDDRQYILSKEDKTVLFFPIPDSFTDMYALMKITRQALTRRLLKQFKVREKVNLTASALMKDSFQSSSKLSYLSSPSLVSKLSHQTVTTQPVPEESSFVDGFTEQASVVSQSPTSQAIMTTQLHDYDCDLLYNFNYPLEDAKTDKTRVPPQMQVSASGMKMPQAAQNHQVLLESFFGQVLAIVQLGVLDRFDPTEMQRLSAETPQKQMIRLIRQKMTKEAFEVRRCEFDGKMREICRSFGGKDSLPLFSYAQTDCEGFEGLSQFTHSVPLIYQSQVNSDDLSLLQPIELARVGLKQPEQNDGKPANNWFSMLVNVCCPPQNRTNFKRELFIKQLILDFNQALCDARIELGLYSQIASPTKPLLSNTADFAQLRTLVHQSALTHSATSRHEKYDVFLQPQELRLSVPLHLTHEVQELIQAEVSQHVSELTICGKDRARLVNAMLSISLIIRVTTQDSKLTKVLIKLPVLSKLSHEKLEETLKKYCVESPSTKVEFTLALGMFALPDSMNELTVIDLTRTVDEVPPKAQEPESPISTPTSDLIKEAATTLHAVNTLKAYPSVIQTIQQIAGDAQAKYVQHRGFLAIIDLSVNQLSLLTYNMNSAKVAKLSQICKAQGKCYYYPQKQTKRPTSQTKSKSKIPGTTVRQTEKTDSVENLSSAQAESDSLSHVASHSQKSNLSPAGESDQTQGRHRATKKKKKHRRKPTKSDDVSGSKNFFWKLYAEYYKENPKLQKLNH